MSNWISVKDRLPINGKQVKVKNAKREIFNAEIFKDSWRCGSCDYIPLNIEQNWRITHWLDEDK